MTKPTDRIVIIGAGIIGLSTAYALLAREPRLSVTLLEAGGEAGHGASWANGSMIHPSQAWPWDEAGSTPAQSEKIARESFDLAQRSSQILRAHFDKFDLALRHRKSGTVKLYSARAALEQALPKLETLVARGLRYEIWGAEPLCAHLGLSRPRQPLYAGVHFPDDHSGPARIYCARLVQALAEMGADMRVNSAAKAITQNGVTLQSGDTVSADSIIVCAGAASAALTGLPIKAVHGYSRTFDLPDMARHLPSIPMMDDAAHMSVTPLGDHLRISGGADDHGSDSQIYQRFEDYACGLLPDLAGRLKTAVKRDWSAARPALARGPMSAHLKDNIWVNSGHGHMGWTLCAGAAAQLADLYCEH